MSPPPGSVVPQTLRAGLRLEPASDFAAVREAARAAREWLARQSLPEADLAAWELLLVEAGNNAVEHAPADRRQLPLEIDLSCANSDVEARVTDHTDGFDLPAQVVLPDFEAEGRRGLFLIKSLSDHVEYWRGRGRNTLVIRKQRPPSPAAPSAEPPELSRRLAETEAALGEMAEELSSSYESLVAMFRYSAQLGTATELPDFAGRLVADLAQLTEADAVIVRLLAPGGGLEYFVAWPDHSEPVSPLPSPDRSGGGVEWEAIRTREDVWFGSERLRDGNDPVSRVSKIRSGVAHTLSVGVQILGTITLGRVTDLPFRAAQIGLLHTFADFLGIQLVNGRLLHERTQAQVTRRELEIAANIQRSLLPVSLPTCPPFELAASCLSARAVGGDYYDAIPVPGGGLLLVIADVMGKGVPAALFAAVLRSTVRSMPGLFRAPAALLAAVNRTLGDDLARVDMFATAKLAFVDCHRGEVTSASAGHGPLLVWQPGAAAAQPADDSGLPLGIDPACAYSQTTVVLPPGAIGLLYTDGVTESRDLAGGLFGEERLAGWISRVVVGDASAERLCQALVAELDRFRAGAPLTDDQTFVFLRHGS